MERRLAPKIHWTKATLPDKIGKEWARGPDRNETAFSTRDTQDMPTAHGPLAYVTVERKRQRRAFEVKAAWNDLRKLRKLAGNSTSFVERERILKRVKKLESEKR
jgi:hypothetical protein